MKIEKTKIIKITKLKSNLLKRKSKQIGEAT